MRKISYILLALALTAACKQRPKQAEEVAIPVEEAVQADTVAAKKAAQALPEEPVFAIVTNLGTIKVKLYKDTPKHRDNFAKLALSGYYDELLFHRVINGFMIQGGDPFTRDSSLVEHYGEGGPKYTIPAEILGAEGDTLHRHKKGALCAARRGDVANPFRASSGSQFYLVQDPAHCAHLDGAYTVFGETVAGFNVIDKIAREKTNRYDRPLRDVRIQSIRPDAEMNKNLQEQAKKEKETASAAQDLQ